MNERARRYLMEQMRGDGRNPYGSRGGYVTSRDPRRRDRGQYDERDMNYRYERDNGHYRGEYERYPYEEMRGDFEYSRQYRVGNRPNEMRGDYGDDYRGGRGGGRGGRDSRGSDYGDYGDYGEEDYRGRRRNSRGQYMSDRGDYGEDMRLSKEDMKEWEKKLVNDDGSHGAHFDKEQIDQVARSIGIEPKEFGDGVLCMTVNMMYSDYCGVAKKFGVDRLEYYIELAKAFLKDKDFDGDGAEKLFLYYTFIADSDK